VSDGLGGVIGLLGAFAGLAVYGRGLLMVGLITLVEMFIGYLTLYAAWDVAHGLDNGAGWVLPCLTVLTVWFDRRRRMLIAHWKFSRNLRRASRRALGHCATVDGPRYPDCPLTIIETAALRGDHRQR
jgi:sugar phosphate permease